MPKQTRARQSAGAGKRYPLNMRTTKAVREKLERAAAASGRSLAQEVEFRLERSFEVDRLVKAVLESQRHTTEMLNEAAKELEEKMRRTDEIREWMRSVKTFDEMDEILAWVRSVKASAEKK